MTQTSLGGGSGRTLQRLAFAPLAIYGLIIYTVLLGVLDDHAESLLEILLDSIITQVVFFAAHVFAHTLGEHRERGLGQALAHALRHSAAMLYSPAPPLVVLLIATLAGVDQDLAVNIALWTSVAVLGVLGFFAYARTTRNIAIRLLGGLGTAFLGVLIMIVEYAIH